MKKLLATTAAALLISGPAFADANASMTYEFQEQNDFFASTLIGMRVYTSEEELEAETVAANANDNWNDIGEINDLIVSQDGDVQAAIVGVGGFLGLGERDVALSMDQIKVMREDNNAENRFLVVAMTKEQLENAPVFERTSDETMQTEEAETQMSDAEPRMDGDRPMLNKPEIEREGYQEASIDQLSAEDLQGKYVYGSNDETVGEIGELLLTDSGEIDKAIINVGGFLGLGEKPVAVTFDELKLMRAAEDSDVRVYIDASQEALSEQPEYEG
ncbi:PRC-barrel domain-containing protein [Litoreibacter roseus]|uniref:PRC-barrel domain-containing protein n=1 Tax=Litoreibacter roseus TaxID=2601869 RepID=A0A6N6JAW4_9RHOB|nr:PRC-barrel domain-containing protein [Litoreibacter roseus]GFE63276.1 hypothetical protein KIN_03500 [Litoreibacter roseus]